MSPPELGSSAQGGEPGSPADSTGIGSGDAWDSEWNRRRPLMFGGLRRDQERFLLNRHAQQRSVQLRGGAVLHSVPGLPCGWPGAAPQLGNVAMHLTPEMGRAMQGRRCRALNLERAFRALLAVFVVGSCAGSSSGRRAEATKGVQEPQIEEGEGATPSCFMERGKVLCDCRLGRAFWLSFRHDSALLDARPLWREQLRRYAQQFPTMRFKLFSTWMPPQDTGSRAREGMSRVHQARTQVALALLADLGIPPRRLVIDPPGDSDAEEGGDAYVTIVPIPDEYVGFPRALPVPEVTHLRVTFLHGRDEIAFEPAWAPIARQTLKDAPDTRFLIEAWAWNREVEDLGFDLAAPAQPFEHPNARTKALAVSRAERAADWLHRIGVPLSQITLGRHPVFIGPSRSRMHRQAVVIPLEGPGRDAAVEREATHSP